MSHQCFAIDVFIQLCTYEVKVRTRRGPSSAFASSSSNSAAHFFFPPCRNYSEASPVFLIAWCTRAVSRRPNAWTSSGSSSWRPLHGVVSGKPSQDISSSSMLSLRLRTKDLAFRLTMLFFVHIHVGVWRDGILHYCSWFFFFKSIIQVSLWWLELWQIFNSITPIEISCLLGFSLTFSPPQKKKEKKKKDRYFLLKQLWWGWHHGSEAFG